MEEQIKEFKVYAEELERELARAKKYAQAYKDELEIVDRKYSRLVEKLKTFAAGA